ncbi:tetratricopeptide repeat protein [Aeromonas caviae]|uniref:tetratricopeptide repeat protein n=1 Tax=Aeromonas caviae TaxID=648 RepID=UPI001E5C0DD3|nr:hypothetical protein [Aeromonas caviae]
MLLVTGDGARRDCCQAVTWFRKAAAQGDAGAQYNLGVMLATGQGIVRDDDRAVTWLKRAAAQGHYDAQRVLSYWGLRGECRSGLPGI